MRKGIARTGLVLVIALLLSMASSYFPAITTIEAKSAKNTTTEKDQPVKRTYYETIVNQQLVQSNNKAASATRLTGEQIEWQVISSGGGRGAAGNFVLYATVGQTAVGSGESDNFGLTHGFQQDFGGGGGGGCCQIRGDVDHSGGVDVSDLGYIVDYLFRGGPPPICNEDGYYAEADVDNSGGVDVSDLGYIVDYLFRGGPPPVPC